METTDQNTPENSGCTHPSATARSFQIDKTLITQRFCTQCYKVLFCTITETAPEKTEIDLSPDKKYPPYWHSTYDLQNISGMETFKKLGWAILVFALICLALITGLF